MCKCILGRKSYLCKECTFWLWKIRPTGFENEIVCWLDTVFNEESWIGILRKTYFILQSLYNKAILQPFSRGPKNIVLQSMFMICLLSMKNYKVVLTFVWQISISLQNRQAYSILNLTEQQGVLAISDFRIGLAIYLCMY